ncbi:unnamed protein product [Closterium sp. NIES-65]|nr:unnamed protein product [Closterium sp. NIES-65]
MGGSKAAAALLVVAILIAMGANAAAKEVVPAKLRVGTVVLVGSLAQPNYVDFDWARCVPVPQGASASIDGGASGGASARGVRGASGGAGDAVVWWDVFGGGDRTVCNAVQLFASPDCSGAVAASFKYTGEYLFRTTKIRPSVKSIRCVLDNICSRAQCPKHSTCFKTKDEQEVTFQSTPINLTPHPSPPMPASVLYHPDNICSRVECPKHSTCIKTKDDQEVGCLCAKGYQNVYGQCQPH